MSKQYTEEFRQEAIRLATTSPQPIAKTARDLGVKAVTHCNCTVLLNLYSLLYSLIYQEFLLKNF